ncbi:MAG: hypothetical protein FJ291_18060 [Planctomycetes bacterium]|nr:hypothetical protein [Planctomycetota bacterium]
MTFVRAENWRERGMQVQAIKDKCHAIVERLGLGEDDARVQAIVHVRQFCNTLAAAPIKLQQSAERPNNVPALLAVLGLSSTADLKSMLGDLNKNAKLSFLTMVQFALENCVNQVLDAMTGKRAIRPFSRAVRLLAERAGIQPFQAKLDALLVPAWMRNSLHANGIHRHDTRIFVVEGEPYAFVEGKRVQCASWSHVLHAVVCSLSVYEEMLTSNAVSALSRIQVV